MRRGVTLQLSLESEASLLLLGCELSPQFHHLVKRLQCRHSSCLLLCRNANADQTLPHLQRWCIVSELWPVTPERSSRPGARKLPGVRLHRSVHRRKRNRTGKHRRVLCISKYVNVSWCRRAIPLSRTRAILVLSTIYKGKI